MATGRVSGLAVSFNQFKKSPLQAIMYLSFVAIMYLYIDNKITLGNQIDYLMAQNTIKDTKIERLQDDVKTLSIKIAELKK